MVLAVPAGWWWFLSGLSVFGATRRGWARACVVAGRVAVAAVVWWLMCRPGDAGGWGVNVSLLLAGAGWLAKSRHRSAVAFPR